MPFNPSSIDELCRRASINQKDLAEKLGTKQPAISRLYSEGASPNARTIDKLYKVAASYGIFDINFYMPPKQNSLEFC